MSRPLPDNCYTKHEDDEWLTRVVIDETLSKFYLYSIHGEKKTVDCEDLNEFMNVLDLIKAVVDEKSVVYAEPPIKIGL